MSISVLASSEAIVIILLPKSQLVGQILKRNPQKKLFNWFHSLESVKTGSKEDFQNFRKLAGAGGKKTSQNLLWRTTIRILCKSITWKVNIKPNLLLITNYLKCLIKSGSLGFFFLIFLSAELCYLPYDCYESQNR